MRKGVTFPWWEYERNSLQILKDLAIHGLCHSFKKGGQIVYKYLNFLYYTEMSNSYLRDDFKEKAKKCAAYLSSAGRFL